MAGFAVARLDDIDEIGDGRRPFRPVRLHFGIRTFGVTAVNAQSDGDRLVNEHEETEPESGEELYVVISGDATFELDGEARDAPAGTFVFADPGVKRTAFAEEPGTTLIALGGTPGQAFEPNGWEVWAPIHALYLDGKYDEAADRGVGLIEANPEYADVAYNVACCESLAGRTTDAIEHLRLAIERSERFREFAAGDTDLDAIREEPAFKELMVQPQAS